MRAILVLAATVLTVTSNPGLAAQPSRAVPNDLIAKASKVAETAYDRVIGRTMNFTNVDLPYLWSHRWLQSELQKSAKREQKSQALQAHLERMRNLNRVARKLASGDRLSAFSYLSTEYYLAQAEFLAAEDDRQRHQAGADKLLDACQHRYEAAWQEVIRYAGLNAIIAPSLRSASDSSHEWAREAIEVAFHKRDRLEVAKLYLLRTTQIEKVAHRFFPERPSREPVWEAAFFCADAELQVKLNQDGADSRKRVRQLREARRDAAKSVYELIWTDILGHRGSFERLYQWSTRLRCAEFIPRDQRCGAIGCYSSPPDSDDGSQEVS